MCQNKKAALKACHFLRVRARAPKIYPTSKVLETMTHRTATCQPNEDATTKHPEHVNPPPCFFDAAPVSGRQKGHVERELEH